mmetsp:Transcript_11329/g.25773  ORF Transcript_11329/g.25773 Transcript_11329/m.25773 type:complete len:129 (-) Transcript_11329:102-488(-)
MGNEVKLVHLVTVLPLIVMGLLLSGIGEADGRPTLRIVGIVFGLVGILFLLLHIVLLGWQYSRKLAERRTIRSSSTSPEHNPVAHAIELAQRRDTAAGETAESNAEHATSEVGLQQRPLMEDAEIVAP